MVNELPIKVEGIIFKKNNSEIEFLLLKRCPEDGGFWQPMTGTPHFDESLKQCLLRELKEEAGIVNNINITNEVYRFHWPKKDYMVVELVYGVELKKDNKIILSPEHTDFKWCNFDEALNLLAKDNNKIALQKFYAMIK